MKKMVALSLATILVAGMCLTGCGTDKKTGKITIFQSKTEIMEGLNALAKEYSDETGIEVEVWETTGDNYYSDLKTDMSTGVGPTLFSLQPGAESQEMADYLADLSDLSFVDKIGAGMANEVNGKVVGIPYTVEGFGLVYNSDLVDPTDLTSKDALISFLEKSGTDGINGLGLSQEDYFLIAHILNTPFAVQEDPDAYLKQVLNGDTRMADNDAFKEFGEVMEAIRTNCTNPVDVTYDNNCGDFATKKTAMIHQGNWCYSMFTDYNVEFDMGITALPISGNSKVAVSVPTAWYVNTDASDDEKQLAKDFLEWLYTSDAGKKYLMDEFGFIPVVEGMTSQSLDPISQSIADAVAAGNTIPWVMTNWPAGIVTTDLAPIAKQFFTSDMTATEFVNQLNDAFVAAAE
ncbi:MAG: ABC transporter substrate-binding protein [Velocimicrobium sp.]